MALSSDPQFPSSEDLGYDGAQGQLYLPLLQRPPGRDCQGLGGHHREERTDSQRASLERGAESWSCNTRDLKPLIGQKVLIQNQHGPARSPRSRTRQARSLRSPITARPGSITPRQFPVVMTHPSTHSVSWADPAAPHSGPRPSHSGHWAPLPLPGHADIEPQTREVPPEQPIRTSPVPLKRSKSSNLGKPPDRLDL